MINVYCNKYVLKGMLFRCPNGKKTIQYKRARLQKYAPYLMKNGLMQSLSVFHDRECTTIQLNLV